MVQNYLAGTIVILAIGYSLFSLVKNLAKKKISNRHDCMSCEGCPLKDIKSDCKSY